MAKKAKPAVTESTDQITIGELEKQIVTEYTKKVEREVKAIITECVNNITSAVAPLKTYAKNNDINIDEFNIKADGTVLHVSIEFEFKDIQKRVHTLAIQDHLRRYNAN